MPTPEDYSSILACSYGKTLLQLEDFTIVETPEVKDFFGRIWTNVSIEATCLLVGTPGEDAADFAIDVSTARVELGLGKRDFIITGVGGAVLYTLLSARCTNDGPNVGFKMSKGNAPLQMRFQLTLTAQYYDAGKATGSFKIHTVTRPDGLKSFVQTGDVVGPNATQYYFDAVIPAVKKAWPLPNYVVEHQYDASTDANQSRVTYTINSTQYFGPLPAIDQGIAAVSGEITVSKDRDEQYRMITVTNYDLLLTAGDPQTLIAQLRTKAADQGAGKDPAIIFRETGRLTTLKEQRISGSFTVLSSADKSPLLEWTETVTLKTSDSWDIRTYPGAAPIAVKRPQGVALITQSGRCRSAGVFKKAPKPILTSFTADPEIDLIDVDTVQKETAWRYEMYPTKASSPKTMADAGIVGTVPDVSYDVNKFDPNVLARSVVDDQYYDKPKAK